MNTIFQTKRAIGSARPSFARKGLFFGVAGSALLAGEAMAHSVFVAKSADGTAAGPFFGGTMTDAGELVPHQHPNFGEETSTIDGLTDGLASSRGSAAPGVLSVYPTDQQVQGWNSYNGVELGGVETASTSPVFVPTSEVRTTQVTLLNPNETAQLNNAETTVTTKNFRNVQSDVLGTEKLNGGSLALTLKDGEMMTAGAGDYAFNGGDVWLASTIAGDLGMVTETTSILSSVSGGGLAAWGPLAAGVAGVGALGLGAAALTGNLPNPFDRSNHDDETGEDGEGDGNSDGAGDSSVSEGDSDDVSGDNDQVAAANEPEDEEEIEDGIDPEFEVTNKDPENEGPSALKFSEFFNSTGSYSLVEQDTIVGTLSADDPEGDELQYRIDSQKLGSTDTKIFAINDENQLILTERLDYSQPGNDADGTLFDHNTATVVIEVSDGSEHTEFRTFGFSIANSTDDDTPLQYVREADVTRLSYNGQNSTQSGAADSTDWLPFMDEAEYARSGSGDHLIASIHSEDPSMFSVHNINGEGGFSGTKNYSVNNSTVIDEKYHIHEVIAIDMDDIDGDGFLDVAVAGRGGTSGEDSVVQIWEAGSTGVFSFQTADKDSEPASVRDVIVGHFNKASTGQETSVTNMKKIMVIGGGTDNVASEDALYTVAFIDNQYEIEGTQLQGNWHFDEVESMVLNDVEYSIGTYGTSDGTGIGMASISDPSKGVVSAGSGIKHNDVAVINNVVFTATDEGIYYNKAFHTHMDTPEAGSISNDGLHTTDIKASQIAAGNFDGDDDLELAVLDVLDQTPIIRFFDVDPTNPQVLTQLYTTEPVPGATELLVIPGSIEESSREDGNIGADELLVGISEAGTSTYFIGEDEMTQTWNGSIIFYDHTSL